MSGDQEWKGLELDAKRGDKLTVLYKKDSSGDNSTTVSICGTSPPVRRWW